MNNDFNNTRAFSEGWGLFNSRVERLCLGPIIHCAPQSREPVFASDEAALAHVTRWASGGSAYHRSATLIHNQSP